MPSPFEAAISHLSKSPDTTQPVSYTERDLSSGIHIDNPPGDRSFYLIKTGGGNEKEEYVRTDLNLSTQTRLGENPGYRILGYSETESKGRTEVKVSLTAQVRPGVIVDVTYDQDGRRVLGAEQQAYHPLYVQRPLFRAEELPDVIDPEATGRKLFDQLGSRNFRQPTLVLPGGRTSF